jgi:AraC-like DNA-binding protein
MLVLDTASISAADRAEVFQSSVSQNCTTSMATFEDPDTLRAEMHVFDLGPAKVFNIEASGTTLRRTPRLARAMNECPIALALPFRTSNHLMWGREERQFGPRDLILVDLSAPYVYGWSGAGASYAFHVDFDQLDLPMDTISVAAREVHKSPIYPLVRDHISRVMTDAQLIVDSGAASHVAAASVELMRALIVSAARDTSRLGQAMHDSMGPRVQAYVRRHLREPDLTPTRVAAANGLSVRALYKLYEKLGVSLEQSIIEQRLQGVRADLSAPSHRHLSIAATARAWGFENPSHFTSRFRRAFGVTPRQWRAGARAENTLEHSVLGFVPAPRAAEPDTGVG